MRKVMLAGLVLVAAADWVRPCVRASAAQFTFRPSVSEEIQGVEAGTQSGKAFAERKAALDLPMDVLPRCSSQREFVTFLKDGAAGSIGSWVDTEVAESGSFDNWFAASEVVPVTNSFICNGQTHNYVTQQTNYPHTTFPMLTVTGLVDVCGLPTNFFEVTPIRDLANAPNGWPGFATIWPRMVWSRKYPDRCNTNCGSSEIVGEWATTTNGFERISGCQTNLPWAWVEKRAEEVPTGDMTMARVYYWVTDWKFKYYDADGNYLGTGGGPDVWGEQTLRGYAANEPAFIGGGAWPGLKDSIEKLREAGPGGWIEERWCRNCEKAVVDSETFVDAGVRYGSEDFVEEEEYTTNYPTSKNAFLDSLAISASTSCAAFVEFYISASTPAGMTATAKEVKQKYDCAFTGYGKTTSTCDCSGATHEWNNINDKHYAPGIVTVTNPVAIYEATAPVQQSPYLKKQATATPAEGQACFPFLDEPNWTLPGDTYPKASGWAIKDAQALVRWNVPGGFKYLGSP